MEGNDDGAPRLPRTTWPTIPGSWSLRCCLREAWLPWPCCWGGCWVSRRWRASPGTSKPPCSVSRQRCRSSFCSGSADGRGGGRWSESGDSLTARFDPSWQAGPGTELALICVAAGVGEEMLCRGVIGTLSHWLGPGAGLIVAGAVFGLLHPITPAYAILAGLIGVYLGGIWMVQGNLLSVMVAHALYDFLALWIVLGDTPIDTAPDR